MKYLLLCLFIPGFFIWNVDSVFSQQGEPFITVWQTDIFKFREKEGKGRIIYQRWIKQ